jgi:sulfur carrier protein
MKIFIEPENKEIQLTDRIKTVLALLNKLNLRPTQALVIRVNKSSTKDKSLATDPQTQTSNPKTELLTPDRRLYPDDNIIIRLVISRG